MKNKKWLLLLIIAFPSFFWLILETSTINSKRLPFYGPKKVTSKNDTSFYQVPDSFYSNPGNGGVELKLCRLDKRELPLYNLIFLNRKYRADSYRLTGLWEYLNYKRDKVEQIPFILVTPSEGNESSAYNELKKLSDSKNVYFYTWPEKTFDSITQIYFKQKPYYVDYSFFVMIDANRRIRGYYDARYVSELKRLIEEYQHLRLKEEKQRLIDLNEIKKSS